MYAVMRGFRSAPLTKLVRTILVDSHSLLETTRKASTTARLFFESMRCSNDIPAAAALKVTFQTISQRGSLDPDNIDKACDILEKETEAIVNLVLPEELSILPEVHKEISKLAREDLFAIGLEGRVDEVKFFVEI